MGKMKVRSVESKDFVASCWRRGVAICFHVSPSLGASVGSLVGPWVIFLAFHSIIENDHNRLMFRSIWVMWLLSYLVCLRVIFRNLTSLQCYQKWMSKFRPEKSTAGWSEAELVKSRESWHVCLREPECDQKLALVQQSQLVYSKR